MRRKIDEQIEIMIGDTVLMLVSLVLQYFKANLKGFRILMRSGILAWGVIAMWFGMIAMINYLGDYNKIMILIWFPAFGILFSKKNS